MSSYHPYANVPLIGEALGRLLVWLAPRYRGKWLVHRRLRRSRVPYVELLPTNFFQNDETVRPEILAGTFLMPVGRKGINRIDVRDIAVAVANALTDASIPTGMYPLVGAKDVTGDDCARVWSGVLGREVRFEGQDLAAWCKAAARAGEPQFTIDDFVVSFGLMARFGVSTTKDDLVRTVRILGRAPTAYEGFAEQARQRWSDELRPAA